MQNVNGHFKAETWYQLSIKTIIKQRGKGQNMGNLGYQNRKYTYLQEISTYI